MPSPGSVTHTAEDYWNLPEGTRAELVDGQIWALASPSRKHQEIVSALNTQIRNFIEAHHGSCKTYPTPFAVNLFADDTTFVEPDVSVVCDRSKLSDRGCEGAPDLIAEVVSPFDPRRDYVTKASLYLEAGVREYWICDPLQERVFAYDFASESVVGVHTFADPVPSVVLPGFEATFAAMLADF